jgi:hypothetical protein
MPTWMRIATTVCLAATLGCQVHADESAIVVNKDKHLGNATCSNSQCHDASQPWKVSAVMQNESRLWLAQDPHAKAYSALKSPQALHIGKNLGIASPQSADECLACHADNVALEKRGPRFNLADGVGCESCHGGAERWLGVHVSGTAGHAENVAAGMAPLDDPFARAQVCAACHVGNADQSVTHRLYASGHPKLVFELDTYTAAGANHFTVTDEYIKRKGRLNHAQTWAIGQAVAAQWWLNGIADPSRFHPGSQTGSQTGMQPELAFFTCDSCHHTMDEQRWLPRAELDHRTGQPRLNDASLRMLDIVATRMAPTLAEQLSSQRVALHRATLQGSEATAEAARAQAKTVAQLTTILRKQDVNRADTLALLHAVSQAPALDYTTAEQLTLAASSLMAELNTDGQPNHPALQTALDGLYRVVNKPEFYRSDNFHAAQLTLQRALPLELNQQESSRLKPSR